MAHNLAPNPRPASDLPAEVMPTSGRRLVGIEGLRAAAALSVMLGHFNLHLIAPGLVPKVLGHLINVAGQGLTLFFVLSGFLLFGPFVNAAARGKPFGTGAYFLNRILRIYPGNIAIFSIVALGLGLAYTRPLSGTDADIHAVAGTIGRLTDWNAIAANLALVHTLFPTTIKTGLGVSWSLTAELCFYVLLPILAIIAVRASPRLGLHRAAVAVSLGMIAVGLVCRTIGELQVRGDESTRFFLEWGGNWMAVYLRSILCQADLFGVGMLAVVAFRYSAEITNTAARRRFRQGLYTAALLGLAVTRIESEFGYATFFAALLLIVTTQTSTARHSTLSKILEWLPIRWMGVISYSFYLWHLPVIWGVYRWYLHEQQVTSWAGVATTYALVLAVTTALSSATYLAVERPALLLKVRPSRRLDAALPKQPVPQELSATRL